MWEYFQNNPTGRAVGDCAVRAISAALDLTWEQAYVTLAYNGYMMGDLINADSVWGATLRQNGFVRETIPNTCPECYTAEDFSNDHPEGTFVLGFGGHVATVKDGKILDSWDSSHEIPIYYWRKNDGV